MSQNEVYLMRTQEEIKKQELMSNFKAIEQHIRILRQNVFNEDAEFGEDCEQKLKRLKPKYLKLLGVLFPKEDKTATSAIRGY